MSVAVPARWWEALYDDWLADTVLADGAARVPATIAFLTDRLKLRRGDRVLDQCCGTGRLALPLAERGFEVVAVDQARSYVERARREARRRGVALELYHADALSFVPTTPVQGAFNWWTSFGYGEEAENLEMLRRACEALSPGGRFALETMDRAALLRSFAPRHTREFVCQGRRVLLCRQSALEGAALRQRWCYRLEDGREIVRQSRVQLYGREELVALFHRAGLREVQIEVGDDPTRAIVMGRRV